MPATPTPIRPSSAAGILISATGIRLPLRNVTVDADIHLGAVSIVTTASFTNDTTGPLEVTYLCPLPAGFAPVAATCELAGRTVTADLVERATAVARYDTAVADGRSAAIAEQVGEELFSFTVGNVAADETAAITVTLVGMADVDDGQATLRIPLSVEERYQSPGTTSVQPTRRHHAGRHELTATIRLRAHGITPTVVTHDATYTTGKTTTVDVAGVELTGDVVVRWPAGCGWTAQVSGRGRRRWLTLTGVGAQAVERASRDVVILVDRSGSMHGWKMAAAVKIADAIVERLNPTDRVSVLAFDTELESVAGGGGFAIADSARRRQISLWLSTLTARGGTELTRALVTASGLLAGGAANATLVIVTDAEIGDEARCVAAVKRCAANVIAVGVGERVNGGLLKAIEAASGGWTTTAESSDRVAEAVGDIARRAAGPCTVIDNVTVDGAADVIWSQPHPNLYPGHQTVLRAELTGKPTTVTVDGPGYREQIPVTGGGSSHARQLWARDRVAELLRSDPHSTAALHLALAAGVLCPLTAFVAVDDSGRQLDDAPTRVEVGHLDMYRLGTTGSITRCLRRSSAFAGGASGAVGSATFAASSTYTVSNSMSLQPAVPAGGHGSMTLNSVAGDHIEPASDTMWSTVTASAPVKVFAGGVEHADRVGRRHRGGGWAALCDEIASCAGQVPPAAQRVRLLGAWAEQVADFFDGDRAADAGELARLIADAVVTGDDLTWAALTAWAADHH